MTCKFEEKQPRRENKWTDHHTVWTRTFQSDSFFFHFLKPHSWIYNYMYSQFQGSDSLYRPMVGKLVMITVGILWANLSVIIISVIYILSAVLLFPFSLMISCKLEGELMLKALNGWECFLQITYFLCKAV